MLGVKMLRTPVFVKFACLSIYECLSNWFSWSVYIPDKKAIQVHDVQKWPVFDMLGRLSIS